MNGLFLTNFGIAVTGVVISLFGLILVLAVRYSERNYKKYFVIIFSILTAYSLSNLVEWIVTLEPKQENVPLSVIGLFCESLFSSMLIPFLTMFVLFCAKKDWKTSPFFYVSAGLWVVYLVLLVLTQFTDWIYYFTADNVYHRGPYYAVLLIPPVLLMAVNLVALFRYWNDLPRRYRGAFFLCILIPLVCMLVQMFAYGLVMTVLGATISAMFLLLAIIQEQVVTSLRQARENARQKASIAVLQMRPHFIYNTMMSIYYLCAQDADKAQQVTLDFTSYLRKNFTAISKEEAISFSEELEHTRAYLAVEKVRFEDSLFVEFDTPETMFRIPPLTLQPIVENAVKHGVDPELDPLYISVRTREVKDGYEIIVEDTGPGFGASDNDDPHIALDNIRERLDLMCRGTLSIDDREQGGTVITVFIPHKNKKA